MARFSIQTLLVSFLLMCLLAEKGLCRPNSNEGNYYEDDSEYPNDDDDEPGGPDEDADNYNGPAPEIVSKSLHLEVKPGERVSLPCETVNLTRMLEVFSVIWKKENTILFVDKLRGDSKDSRFVYNSHDNSLVINNVNKKDSGMYYCRFSSSPEVELVHSVNVFAPAEVKGIEPAGQIITVRKDMPLSLKCNVTGYPIPEVKWIKKGKHDSGEGSVVSTSTDINVNKADRHDSGSYQCTAENDQGPAAVSAHVTVRVQYAPEIDTEDDSLALGVGHNAVLKCIVHAEPKAKVQWFVNDTQIVTSPTSHIRISQEGHKHFLNIEKMESEDFGMYSCNATNTLGIAGKLIEVTGKPHVPKFIGAEIRGEDGRNLLVEWHTVSYSPLTQYLLLYKKQKDGVKWDKEHPAVVETVEGNIYVLKHELKNLSAGDFIVTLRAANLYGWTNQAKPYHFTIKEENHNHEVTAETSKLEKEDKNGNLGSTSTRPRIMAILTIISLSTFFL